MTALPGPAPSWWPQAYADILDDFGWDAEDDLAAARTLQALVPQRDTFRHVGTELKHRPLATVVGCGPALDGLRTSDLPAGIVIAADGATTRLREIGVVPRIVVTDLDGDPQDLVWAAEQGASMVVHAHGHNTDRLEDLVPSLGPFVAGTHQWVGDTAAPGDLAPLCNLGGFTDGDRAVVVCEAFGVREVRLACFDLDAGPSHYSHAWDPATKARKLAWAKRIIQGVQDRGRTRVTTLAPASSP